RTDRNQLHLIVLVLVPVCSATIIYCGGHQASASGRCPGVRGAGRRPQRRRAVWLVQPLFSGWLSCGFLFVPPGFGSHASNLLRPAFWAYKVRCAFARLVSHWPTRFAAAGK